MKRGDILKVGIVALIALAVLAVIISSIAHDLSGYRVNVLDEEPSKLSYAPVFKQVSAGNWSGYLGYRTLYVSYIEQGDAFKFLVTCDYKCSATAERIGNFMPQAGKDAPLSVVYELVVNNKYRAYVKFVNGEYQVAFQPNE